MDRVEAAIKQAMPNELHDDFSWDDSRLKDDMTDEEVDALLKDVPVPQHWWVLVSPRRPKRKSAGGIVLAESSQDAEVHLNYVGKVIAMGSLCGESEAFKDMEGENHFNTKVGDWIIFNRYQGMRIEHRGVSLLVIKDEHAMCKVSNPMVLRVYA